MDNSIFESPGHDHISIDEKFQKPFMCGVCQERFCYLDVYLLHVKSHGGLSDKVFHLCSDSSNNEHIQTDKDLPAYQCRICYGHFTSICLLHNHIVNGTGDGSYIFDHTRNTAFPLSMHCAGYEDREYDLEESKKCEDKAGVTVAFEANANDDRTFQRVDNFLCNFRSSKSIPAEAELSVRISKRVHKPKDWDDNSEISVVSMNKNKNKTYAEKSNSKLNGKKKVKPIQNSMNKVQKTGSKRTRSNPKKAFTAKSEKKLTNGLENVSKDSVSSCVQKDDGTPSASVNTDFVESPQENMKTDIADNSDIPDQSASYSNEMVTEPVNKDTLTVGSKMDNESSNDGVENESIGTEADTMDLEREMTSDEEQFATQPSESELKVRKSCKIVECPHCCKVMQPCRLKKHLVSHLEDRPYKCDECPKAYKHLSHLQGHKATHLAIKPYYCEFCGKGMTTITVLKHHVMMHHSVSKPCCCNICGASFITNYKLRRHMSKHTGLKSFQCDLCGMGFSTRYNLSVHIRGVHKKDLRFSCAQCDKHFMTNYQLKVHLMKHSGERPYKCSVCKADYVERKELRRHLKKQHNLVMDDSYTDQLNQTPQTDGSAVPEMYNEDINKYSIDHKSDMNTSVRGLMGSFPSMDLTPGEMNCDKNEHNIKLFPSKQLRMNSADVQEFTRNESMIPGVPLTVTAMNSSFIPVISDQEVCRDGNHKISYEHDQASVITLGE